jgi:multicomponent Na+:H+ antiporter subunit D
MLGFTLFELLPGLSFALRADALSMIFALVGVVPLDRQRCSTRPDTCAGHEHAQTRFNTCFALALFGAIGCAFADNLLTLYLFYEIVSVCTYPLVAHHQDDEGYEGAKEVPHLSHHHRQGADPAGDGADLRALGTLDFAANAHTGILPAGVHNSVIIALYICCLLGFAKNGIMPLHTGCPARWSRQRPSARCSMPSPS